MSRYENKIFIFGGIDKDFMMTNKTLVLEFDQLHINPLYQDKYQDNRRSSQVESGGVDLQFFSMKQGINTLTVSDTSPKCNLK